MALRRLTTEVVDAVRKAPRLEERAMLMKELEGYVTWGPAMAIAIAAAAGAVYVERSQLNTVKVR
jgi:hypothetical protein